MNTTVIICSFNRSKILHDTVTGLLRQTCQPAAIVLSLCDEKSALPETRTLPGVHCVFGPQGSSAQRNTAIPLAETPFVLFLDDDVELAPDYIEQMERVFLADHTVVAASGEVVEDGAKSGKGIERAVALTALRNYSGSRDCTGIKIREFYGCNMFVRTDVLGWERFDERLPLYSWLEDRDFLFRCSRHGKLIRNRAALIAHLATRSGRTSDVRYGYTKIANPFYMWRKGVIPTAAELVVMFWIKTTFANVVRSLAPRQPPTADYRRRLKGNLMAYRDLFRLRIDPRNILEIPDSKAPAGQVESGRAWQSEPTRTT